MDGDARDASSPLREEARIVRTSRTAPLLEEPRRRSSCRASCLRSHVVAPLAERLCSRSHVVAPLAERLCLRSHVVAPLAERLCLSSHVVAPLAKRLCLSRHVVAPLAERLCLSSHVVAPLAERLCLSSHVVAPLAERLCSRSHVVAPLAERLCLRSHVVAPLAERLCLSSHVVAPLAERLCLSSHVVAPLAARLSVLRERLSALRERLSALAERLPWSRAHPPPDAAELPLPDAASTPAPASGGALVPGPVPQLTPPTHCAARPSGAAESLAMHRKSVVAVQGASMSPRQLIPTWAAVQARGAAWRKADGSGHPDDAASACEPVRASEPDPLQLTLPQTHVVDPAAAPSPPQVHCVYSPQTSALPKQTSPLYAELQGVPSPMVVLSGHASGGPATAAPVCPPQLPSGTARRRTTRAPHRAIPEVIPGH